MTHILAQVAFTEDSGVPADTVINTWHFDVVGNPPTAPELAFMDTLLTDFYTAVPTGQAQSLDSFLSNRLQSPADITYYSMADPTPRQPRGTGVIAFTPGPDCLPSEVALCLSFQAVRISGQAQRERRGRIYLGPFDQNSIETSGPNIERPVSDLTDIVRAAAQDLFDASNAVGTLAQWVVNAPANGTTYPIVDGWVDNAWDTQRRRGRVASTRLTFS